MKMLSQFLLLACAACSCVEAAHSQIVWIDSGQSCSQTSDTAPIGTYYGTLVECDVTALCSGTFLFSLITAEAYSGLACPNHFVENNANSGWNFTDAVNANALALDLFNGEVRGSSFAQEACGAVPLQYQNENQSVCDDGPPIITDPPPDPPGGGGDGGGVINCYYGYDGDDFGDDELMPDMPFCDE